MLKQAFLSAAISTTLLAGCATTPTHTAHAPMYAANIVDVAKSNPDFSILVEAANILNEENSLYKKEDDNKIDLSDGRLDSILGIKQ